MAESTLTGSNLIAAKRSALGEARFSVSSRLSGEPLAPSFAVATEAEIAAACSAAHAAFPSYSAAAPEVRAGFLRAIASHIEELGDVLIERASAETALPAGRLTGERARTCAQLRMFADLVAEGSWVDARIDTANPNRTPPKPDIRRMLVPIGPVGVFGASNFPLAFSVAGGDTASALAAGCPVLVKAHPAHPGTSELVGRAIVSAARGLGLPAGVFGMLHGGAEVGQALVMRPEIYAVGFTGSQRAGRALYDLTASRPRPIPVFAEMGSVDPVFLLPGALKLRGEAIAKGYAESLTLGVGQFCTNPGIVVALAGDAFDRFLINVAGALAAVSPGVMLTEEICARYQSVLTTRSAEVPTVILSEAKDLEPTQNKAHAGLFSTTAANFLAKPELAEEIFGPAGLAVACASIDEMTEVAKALEGQLTATIHMTDEDQESASDLLPILTRVAGRVLFNGFPTGVEVCPAMQHGGPYPATTDSQSTSVGTAAIFRFARPVAFQNTPANLLPPELRDANPRGIRRLVDGQYVP